jgi:putative serine protease PepD
VAAPQWPAGPPTTPPSWGPPPAGPPGQPGLQAPQSQAPAPWYVPPPATAKPRAASDVAPLWLRVLAVVALVALCLVASVGWYLNDQAAETANRAADDLTDELDAAQDEVGTLSDRVAALEASQSALPDLAETVAATKPSVWTIVTETGGVGSGWVATSDGGTSSLVTNYHVIEDDYEDGQRQVEVVQEARTLSGTVISVDEAEDLALIEVDAELPTLRLATTGARVGDPVLVLGSPLGLEQTAVSGIVSAFRDDLIQFSAPISPGNSGGPVLNADGEVIGITELKIAEEAAEGLGFAIPVGTLCVTVLSC